MKIAIQCVSCMFILVISAKGQQIGSLDLAHPPALGKFAERQERRVHPNGCEKIGGGIADGAVIPKKNQPHKIMLEVTSVSNKEPVAGSVVQAEVRLQNTGEYPIEIPWSPDPNTVERNQNPNRRTWEEGRFQVLLDPNDLLKSTGQTLYGSKFSEGSMFTIHHGEWITAAIDVKLELEYPILEQVVRAGKRQLRAEWEQASHSETLDLTKCVQSSGYFTYRNFYQQLNPAITISITKDRSSVR